ncbi:MAG: hypothetical protein HKM04_04925 [Legionellales bacterium]|nr:hypothetical protein [Legionellales bacterium]
MYITDKHYLVLPAKKVVSPRDRFIRYYNDLADLEKQSRPTDEIYLTGDQYSYAELGDAILHRYKNDNVLNNLELLVICYWGHEFDPDYSFGAYLCDKYNIKAKNFDICDQSILSPVTAIQVIQSFFHNKQVSNALLVCFDQTTIPTAANYVGSKPEKSSVASVLFSNQQSDINQYQIVDSKCLSKSALKHHNFSGKTINLVYSDTSKFDYSSAGIMSSLFQKKYFQQGGGETRFYVHDIESSDVGIVTVKKSSMNKNKDILI